jgi:tetratricopeptide (TPR) repeat protein
MIKMKNFNLAVATVLAAAFLSGCALKNMVKLAADQDLQVDPNPLELHGGEVPYNISVTLPPKMLPSGKIYTVKNFYQYGDKEIEVGEVEFKADEFPSSSSTTSRKSADFKFNFTEDMTPGKLIVQGVAKDPNNGKELTTAKLEVAVGVITTSNSVKNAYVTAVANHGYNDQEELVPTNIDFYFPQGSSVLAGSIKTDGESNSAKQKNLSAFIADKNVTRTVTITGTHSPEGNETINTDLSADRAERIEKYYRAQMKKYDYKGMADSIKFIIKPVVQDWTALNAALREYEGIDEDAKNEFRKVIYGTGSFEDKEKALQKISGYKKVFDDLYPSLRTAKTEILTVKVKKAPETIAVLAKQIVAGEVSGDTLSNEEFLYAATLTPSLDEKEGIYNAATKRDGSWVAHNNLAAVYLEKAKMDADNREKLVQDALTQLEIAANKSEAAEVQANMGSAYMMQGEYDKAYEAFGGASAANNELKADINSAKASIEIRNAKYEDAKASLASAGSKAEANFNRGLVSLLTDEYSVAQENFGKTVDSDYGAEAYYLKAVTAARAKNASEVISNLKEAIGKDSSLKDRALADLEFVNFADAVAQALR